MTCFLVMNFGTNSPGGNPPFMYCTAHCKTRRSRLLRASSAADDETFDVKRDYGLYAYALVNNAPAARLPLP